jgi:hypothetical protein
MEPPSTVCCHNELTLAYEAERNSPLIALRNTERVFRNTASSDLEKYANICLAEYPKL